MLYGLCMKYQLVLQFSASSDTDFQQMLALEESLAVGLSDLADVDGHDFGSGEMNIFLLTDHPTEAFAAARSYITQPMALSMRAAYRILKRDRFTILWPPGLQHFGVR